jgi:hypothetical protein
MRAFMIAGGLAATALVAGLIWFSAQLTTHRALETDEAPEQRLAIEGLRFELSCLVEIEWPSRCPRITDAGSSRLWSAVDVSTILQQGFRSRLNDTLNIKDPTNQIQSLLKRIR